jgi:hypothetical protein
MNQNNNKMLWELVNANLTDAGTVNTDSALELVILAHHLGYKKALRHAEILEKKELAPPYKEIDVLVEQTQNDSIDSVNEASKKVKEWLKNERSNP